MNGNNGLAICAGIFFATIFAVFALLHWGFWACFGVVIGAYLAWHVGFAIVGVVIGEIELAADRRSIAEGRTQAPMAPAEIAAAEFFDRRPAPTDERDMLRGIDETAEHVSGWSLAPGTMRYGKRTAARQKPVTSWPRLAPLAAIVKTEDEKPKPRDWSALTSD